MPSGLAAGESMRATSCAQCAAVQCAAVQCAAVQCAVVQCAAVQCAARVQSVSHTRAHAVMSPHCDSTLFRCTHATQCCRVHMGRGWVRSRSALRRGTATCAKSAPSLCVCI
eukprot:4816089-Prymnesium_polylepis.1